MTRWQPLPGDADPATVRLVVGLRELKDRVGVSIEALARKTPYSKSSWQRYLNGRMLPPLDAVDALARLAGVDPVPLCALWEVAAQPGPRPSGVTDSTPAAVQSDPLRWGRRRWWWLVAAPLAVVVLAISLGMVLEGSPLRHETAAQVLDVHCRYQHHGTLLFAGHSTTSERLVALNSAGPDVVEVQCLLRRHRCDPGRVDGRFGPLTKLAVQTLQRRSHEVDDGIVGPHTWALLRA